MSDFTNPTTIHSCLGEYWYSIYLNNEQVGSYVASICFNRSQWDYQFKDTKKCLSRKETPVYELVKVKPITVLKSDFLKSCEVYAQHDGTYKYNGQIYYDVPVLHKYILDLPDDIADAKFLSAKLLSSTKYPIEVVNNQIPLEFSIFDGDFVVDPVYDENGKVIDYKTTVWLFEVSVDHEDMYYQYGYIFNIRLKSSENYNNLINVLYDSLINGPSENSLRLYISAVTGIPVILHDNETIVDILCDTIITDKETYEVSQGDKIIVNVGDTLNTGDVLTSGLTFYKPSEIDDTIRALSLDRHYISTCASEIVFENIDLPIKTRIDSNYTRVDLPVSGNKIDVDVFNYTTFVNGIANNTKLDPKIEELVLRELFK